MIYKVYKVASCWNINYTLRYLKSCGVTGVAN